MTRLATMFPLLLLLLSGSNHFVYAQENTGTRLILVLQDQSSSYVNGTVYITGSDTTIEDNDFDGNRTYYLTRPITGIEDFLSNDPDLFVSPNPTSDGQVMVRIVGKKNGILEAYNLLGQQLGKVDITCSNNLSFYTLESIILLRYISASGQDIKKLVTLAPGVTIDVMQSNDKPGAQQFKTTTGDEYDVDYTDPMGNIEGKHWNLTIIQGESYTIDEKLVWSVKHDTIKINVLGGLEASFSTPAHDAIDLKDGKGEATFADRYDANKGKNYGIAITGDPEWSEPLIRVAPFATNATVAINDTLIHTYRGLGAATSATTLDFVVAQDTIASTTAIADAYFVEFKRKAVDIPLEIHARNGQQHKVVSATFQPGPNTNDIDFEAILNNFWVYGNTTSSTGGGLAGVDVKAYKNGTALMSGVSGSGGAYETNHLSREGETMTLDSIVYKLTGYNPFNTGSVSATKDGWRKDVTMTPAAQPGQNISLYDLNSSPTGMAIKVWDNNEIIMNATVDANGDYTTNTINRILPFVADSLVATYSGYNKFKETNVSWTVAGGKLREIDLTPATNPLETFYVDAGTTTRNAQIVIKDGSYTIGTLTADANGYVSSTSFDYQLENGKTLILQYGAPNADGENVTKTDVDDEEHVSIAYLLNAHFNFNVTADAEVGWDINGEEGTGNGSATLEARANSLDYIVSADATDADHFSKDGVANPGSNIENITMMWQYHINMAPTKSGSAIIGSFNTTQAYTATGTGGTVQKTFTRSGVKSGTLRVEQTLAGYNKTDQNFNVSKGTSNVALDEMTPTTDPVETVYFDAGTTGSNAQVRVKVGGTTIKTLTANIDGYVAASNVQVQIPAGGIDLILEYDVVNGTDETRNINDVTDGQHIGIANPMVMRYSFTITPEHSTINWTVKDAANANIGTGTGNGSFIVDREANSLAYVVNASGTDVVAYSDNGTARPGTTSESIDVNWQFRPSMQATENGASIIGTVSGSQVYSTTGTGGTVGEEFTHTNRNIALRIQQTRTNHTSSDQTFDITPGSSSMTLNNLLAKYTLVVSNTVTGTSATWNLNGTLADTETGSGTLTLYKEIDTESATSALELAASGYQNWNDNRTISPGTTSVTANQQEEAQGQEYTFSGRVISINGSDYVSGTGVLRFETPYGTYYANSSGGSFSVTVMADPNQNVSISGNASGYEPYFLSVVGRDSKTGSGPASVDPDNLDDGSIDYILGRSDIVNNATWQATLGSPGGFYRGASVQRVIHNYNYATGGEAGQNFVDAQTTAMNAIPAAVSTGIYGSLVNISGGVQVVTGEPLSSAGKILIVTDTDFNYTNAQNPGMDGTWVIVSGTNINSTFTEAMEWLTGQGGEGYFFSGTNTTEAGKAKIVYTSKFGY